MKEQRYLPKIGEAVIEDNSSHIVLSKDDSKELHIAIRKMADALTWKSVILRGLIGGLFTAIGATMGLALLIYVVVNVYTGLQGVPLIKQFMNATGLDQVVEYVIKEGDLKTIPQNNNTPKEE